MRILAVVLARAGSKGIKNKNIASLNGRPLIWYAIDQLRKTPGIDKIVVSTDGKAIKDSVKELFGDLVVVLDRPSELSSDTASSESALGHAISSVGQGFDWTMLVQCTSPLTESCDFARLVESAKDCDSAAFFYECDSFLFDVNGDLPLLKKERLPRQQKVLHKIEAGNAWLFRTDGFIQSGSRLFGKIGLAKIEKPKDLEIDSPADIDLASCLLRQRSASKERRVWWNGELIPESEAKVSIYDSALMFGDMIFEMTRSFNKKQFRLGEHIDRLIASAKYVRIPLPMSKSEIQDAVYEVIEANDHLFSEDDEHRIMIDVTRGTLSIYEGRTGAKPGTNIVIADFPLRWTVAGMGKIFDTGINAVITSQRAIPADLLEPKVKNRSRLHYLMANIEASQHKGDNNWALLLDPDGFVAEGTGDNFFIVKDKVVVTPEPRNILRGISRGYVLELCDQLALRWEEKNLSTYDVMTADEAFMTGTPFCILPVTSINRVEIGDGSGEVVLKLLDAWGAAVHIDIAEQIRRWDRSSSKPVGVSPYSFGK